MPLTVADFASHLNADAPPAEGSQDRVEMQRALDAAVEETTRRTGMLDGVTVTVQVSARSGDRALRLPYVRLASVGAVSDPSGFVAAPSYVDLVAGVIELAAATTVGAWSVVCTGKPWPSALVTSTLDWATHMYDTQRTVTNPVSDDDQPSPTFSLPNRVEELQRPYLLAGFA